MTAILVSRTSAPTNDPVSMIYNHPFQFFIYDKSEDLVLFEGRVGEPQVPETEPAEPLLDALHSDDDFWSKTFGVNPVDPTDTESDEAPATSSSSLSYFSIKECFSVIIGALLGFVLTSVL